MTWPIFMLICVAVYNQVG